MAIDNYTPEQIEEILQAFFEVAGTRQYIGARYVPIFGRGRGTSVDWDNSDAYEPLSIVYYQGDTYTSRRYVPAGISIDNQDYWVITGRYDAQVEQYRQEVLGFSGRIDALQNLVESDYVPFPDSDHYPKYGTLGQVLTTLANGETQWVDPVVPSDAQAEAVIGQWLEDHPEATTTVQDGAVTTAKLADGAVTTPKLADGAVTDAKLAMADGVLSKCESLRYLIDCVSEPTSNICDISVGAIYTSSVDGHFAFPTNGRYCGIMELLACSPSTQYSITYHHLNGNISVAYFDSDKQFISLNATNQSSTVVTTPATCAYMHIFVYSSSGVTIYDDSAFQVVQSSTVVATYEQPIYGKDETARTEIDAVSGRIDEITEKTYNLNEHETGRYRLKADGTIEYAPTADAVFGISQLVPVEASTTYDITAYGTQIDPVFILIGQYTSGKALIERPQDDYSKHYSVTTSATTAYMCVQYYRNAGIPLDDTHGIQISKTDIPLPYEGAESAIDWVARNAIYYPDDGVPTYFRENVEDAVESATEDIIPIGRHGDAFVFITDVHWRNNAKHSPALVKYVIDHTNVNMVINGGDNIQGHLSDKALACAEIMEGVGHYVFDRYALRCFGVFGNHDDNSNNNAGSPETHLTKDDQFSVINRFYGCDNLVYGNSGNYYYYDNDTAKIRYIFLDWYANQTEQTTWITNTMTGLPSGYSCVVIIHGIYAYDAEAPNNLVIERQYVLDAFEPYKDDVLFFIQGHTHMDAVVYVYDNDTPVIITTCDTMYPSDGSVRNTVTEHAFDIVVFDTVTRKVHLTRVGRGQSRTIDMGTV